MFSTIVGVVLFVAGDISNSLGATLQRRSKLLGGSSCDAGKKSARLGLILVVVGALLCACSLIVAPQSLLAPLMLTTFIVTPVFAWCLNREPFSLCGLLLTFVISIGIAICIFAAPHDSKVWTEEEVKGLLQKPLPLVYIFALVVSTLGLAGASRICSAHRGIIEATCCGVLGGLNMTLTKGLLAIVVAGLDDLRVLLSSWVLYVLGIGLLSAYVLELATMSTSLSRETATMPILSLIVICEESCALVGGLLVFEEWHLYTPAAAICIGFGNSLAVLAVIFLCMFSTPIYPIQGEVVDSAAGEAFLSLSEILVTVDDVGPFLSRIGNALGLWVNYAFSLERQQVLSICNRSLHQRQDPEYRIKSISPRMKACPAKFIRYCKHKGIKAVVPTSIEDSIFVAENRLQLNAIGTEALVCDDAQIYCTLDHKWLSYLFCKKCGLPQPETLPLKHDTLVECRRMVEQHLPSPCYLKRTYGTWAGLGVTKVHCLEEYDKTVDKIKAAGCLSLGDVADFGVKYVIQKEHPASVFGSQSIWYKGELVSVYLWKENLTVVRKLAGSRLQTVAGRFGTKEAEPSMFKVQNKVARDDIVKLLRELGRKANFTGMMDVDFLVEEGQDSSEATFVQILECNPRFSGGVHASLGSGFLSDYMCLLWSHVSRIPDERLPNRAMWPLVRSDDHEPRCKLQDYNVLGFYARHICALLALRSYRVFGSNALGPQNHPQTSAVPAVAEYSRS